MSLAYHNLLQDKLRSTLSIAGVGLAIMLILILNGFLLGGHCRPCVWLEDGAFMEMATMATDPVCGMKIEREKAVMTEWNGQSYSFCSKGCRREFLEEPQQFLSTVPQ